MLDINYYKRHPWVLCLVIEEREGHWEAHIWPTAVCSIGRVLPCWTSNFNEQGSISSSFKYPKKTHMELRGNGFGFSMFFFQLLADFPCLCGEQLLIQITTVKTWKTTMVTSDYQLHNNHKIRKLVSGLIKLKGNPLFPF